MKIKVIRDTKISSGWIKTGTDHEAREVGFFPNRRFQIIEGKFQGEFVPENNAIRLPDEPTYSEHQYNALKQNFYETCKQRDKVIKDLATHAQTIVDLQKDKLLLLQQIESEVDRSAGVVLPKDVADALEYLSSLLPKKDILRSVINIPEPINQYDKIYVASSLLRDYEFDDILLALVNGYEVEPTKLTTEQKMQARLESEIVSSKIDSPIPVDQLAHKLTLALREVWEEDRLTTYIT
jgi:hypothetical protein